MPEGSGALWRVLGLLGDSPRKCGTGYEARCPAHEDHQASLSIGTGLDGRVLLNCHAGCPVDRVVAALGLSMADLFERSAAGNPVRRFRLLDTSGRTVAVHVREDLPDHEKEIWWESGQGRKHGLNGKAVISLPLYRLPDVLGADMSVPVIVCEGESAADALAGLGLLTVGTVTGADQTPSPDVLAVLRGRLVWLWPDNDDAGRRHMQRIAASLRALGVEVSWVDWEEAPAKGDAADYVAGGGLADGVRALLRPSAPPEHLGRTGDFEIIDMAELQRKVLREPRWAVPSIFPEGVVLLAGKGKLGKSWFAMDVAKAVSSGAKAWGKVRCEQGEVLYLALEDSERRLQDRSDQIFGGPIKPLTFLAAIRWPRADEGGLELVLEWLSTHPNARLVIIDVLAKFRPKRTNSRQLYDQDYEAIAPIAEVARKRGVCILILHHANKLKPDDPVDSVSGTTGLAGAADAVCIFRRERGKVDASLLITGRDVEEQELAFKFTLPDHCGHAWELMGDAVNLRLSSERQDILDVVTAQPGLKRSEIANALGKSSGNVGFLLFRMMHDGQLRYRDSGYFPGLLNTPANAANPLTPEIKNGRFLLATSFQAANALATEPISTDSTDSTVSGSSGVSAPEQPAGSLTNSEGEDGETSPPLEHCSACGGRLFPDEHGLCERCEQAR